MKTILLTSFEGFLGKSDNFSFLVSENINNSNVQIIKEVLPVAYDDAPIILNNLYKKYLPDIIISLGEAGKYQGGAIYLENISKNIMNANKFDNNNIMYINQVIDSNISNELKLEDNFKNLNNVKLSNDAGSYVCNRIMFEGLKIAMTNNIKSYFIHIPRDDYKNIEAYTKYLNNFIEVIK